MQVEQADSSQGRDKVKLWITEEEFGEAKRGVSQTLSDSCNDHMAWILLSILFIYFNCY